MELVKVKYTGPKAHMTVAFPVPFLSKSEKVGEVEFVRQKGAKESVAEMPMDWAEQLVTQPGNTLFELVTTPKPAQSGGAIK